MNRLIALLFFAGYSFAQTGLTGGAQILPKADHSAVNSLQFLDLTGHFLGLHSPASVAANVDWQMPAADGSAGMCWGWTAPKTLDWVACGAGGFVTIGTVQTITASKTFQQSASNTGAATITVQQQGSSTDNLQLWKNSGGTAGVFIDFAGNIRDIGSTNIGDSSSFFNNAFIQDVITGAVTIEFGGANKAFIGWDNVNGALSIVNNIAQVLFEFDAAGQNVSYWDMVPSTTSTRNLGGSSLYWNNEYVNTIIGPSGGILNITGNVQGSGSFTGVILDGTALVIANVLDVGSGGVGTNLIPATGSLTLGNSANFWLDGYIQELFVDTVAVSSGATAKAFIGWDATNSAISFVNNIAALTFEISNAGGATSYGPFLPHATSTDDLGSSSLYWNNEYINTIIGPSGGTLNITGNVVGSGSIAAGILGATSFVSAPLGVITTVDVADVHIVQAGFTQTYDFIQDGSGNLLFAGPGFGLLWQQLAAGTAIKFNENVTPVVNNTNDLGTASIFWNNLYVKNINFENITGLTQCLHANSSGLASGTGNDCAVVPGTWSTWSPTITNLSAITTNVNAYTNSGKTVSFAFQVQGTLNGSAPVITLPINTTSSVAQLSTCSVSVSGGSTVGVNGLTVLGEVILTLATGSAWPSAVTAQFICSGTYQTN